MGPLLKAVTHVLHLHPKSMKKIALFAVYSGFGPFFDILLGSTHTFGVQVTVLGYVVYSSRLLLGIASGTDEGLP